MKIRKVSCRVNLPPDRRTLAAAGKSLIDSMATEMMQLANDTTTRTEAYST